MRASLPHLNAAGAQGTVAFREVLPRRHAAPAPARRREVGAGRVGARNPGILGRAGTEEGAPLAAPSKQRSLFSMVPARRSYRTPLPVPFKGPTLCDAARVRKV